MMCLAREAAALLLLLLHLCYTHPMSQPKLCVVRVVLEYFAHVASEHYAHLLMSTSSKVGRVSRKKRAGGAY